MATPALSAPAPDADAISDGAILNFALNLEYLEAEFYSYAVHGEGLPEDMTHGTGQRGPVEGGREVGFQSRSIRQFAAEIARDDTSMWRSSARRWDRPRSPGRLSTSARASPTRRSPLA